MSRKYDKDVFIPMTLENVGTEGKFFTDATVLKLGGILLLAAFIIVYMLAFFEQFIPAFLALLLAVFLGLIICIPLINKFVIRLSDLRLLYSKGINKLLVNVSEDFSDIYEMSPEGVCFHNDGSISMVVVVVRGTTVGMTDEEVSELKACKQDFESAILSHNYGLKEYNIEIQQVQTKLFEQQEALAHQQGYQQLYKDLVIEHTFLQAYMEACVRDELDVYVIVGKYLDLSMLVLRAQQAVRNFNHSQVSDIHIVNSKQELDIIGQDYFDVDYFDVFMTDNSDSINEELNVMELLD